MRAKPVVVLTALLASVGGLGLGPDHPVTKDAALIAAALATLGYGVSHALVKKSS